MNWLSLPGLTDGQYLWVCFGAVAFMAVTGWGMARSLRRRCRAASRRHPANRAPYDWAADRRLRQPGHVRKVA